VPRGQPAKQGDTTVARNGYHYTRTETKWRLTHHLIAEKALGRPLTKEDRAVFRDGDRTNLDPSNIAVVKKSNGKSVQARIAILDSKIADLTAERDLLKQELTKK